MRLLAIEVADGELRVARAERTFGALRVTALARVPVACPEGLADALAGVARPRPDVVVTALAPHVLTHRTVVLPFRDRRRLARTAPLELLGQLPVDGAGLAIASVPLGRVADGTAVFAAAVRETDLAAWQAPFVDAGLPAPRVDVGVLPAWNLLPSEGDLALLVADGPRSAVTVRRDGRLAGLRALDGDAADAAALAAEARWALAALGGAPDRIVLAGADATRIADAVAAATGARVVPIADAVRVPMPADGETLAACAVAAGLVAGAAERISVGLTLAEPSAPERASLRRAGLLAAVAVALAVGDVGVLRQGLARRDAALGAAIRAEAAAALPGARLVAPRAQLDAAVAAATRREMRLGGRTSVLELLRELSARVPETVRLDVDELTVEPDAVLLHGRCESFDAVDGLRRALAGSPILADVAAEETRTTVDGRGVEFRLRAARRAVLGASS